MMTLSSGLKKDDKIKVCMFVYNSFRPDIRVLKEAKSLQKNGYEVQVMALLDNNSIPYQEYDHIKVHRINRNPFHVRLIQWIKNTGNLSTQQNKPESNDTFNVSKRYIKTIIIFLLMVGMIEFFHSFEFDKLYSRYRFYIYGLILFLIVNRKKIYFYLKKYKLKQLLINITKTLFSWLHSYLSYFDYYKRCYKIIRLSPADIYHAHDLNTLSIAWWCKKRLGGQLVYDSHELFTEQSMLTKKNMIFWTFIENILIKKCDQVITVCDSIAEELQQRYHVDLPRVIKNCPENNGFLLERKDLIREITGISKKTPIILYQGGFSNNRGLRKLIIASSYFKQGKLVMMGWGNIENELKRLVDDKGLQDRVHFIPPVPQNELLFWSASADVGIIPYRAVGLNNYYSCPNKLFEYINSGLPVAGSAFPEISKIINGWNLGITFNPENSKSIANAVNEILSDANSLKSMRLNAIKASEVLNWQCESTTLLTLYAKLGF